MKGWLGLMALGQKQLKRVGLVGTTSQLCPSMANQHQDNTWYLEWLCMYYRYYPTYHLSSHFPTLTSITRTNYGVVVQESALARLLLGQIICSLVHVWQVIRGRSRKTEIPEKIWIKMAYNNKKTVTSIISLLNLMETINFWNLSWKENKNVIISKWG